ncbi:MAG: acetoin utilization protein AcuC [Acidiferrobacterales bacterium]
MVLQVYVGDDLARYGFGEGHPFGPDRLDAFWREAVKQGLDKKVRLATPASCSESDIRQFHTPDYVARVKQQSATGTGYLDYGDTPAFEGVFEAASYVVGTGLNGLAHCMSGECPRMFVPIAGLHHARKDSAAGFCVFNDPGVLIVTVRQQYGLKRVAYVDIDAHHGDGVFYAFEDDPDLIFADIHEDGRFLYPGTGFAHETGKGSAKGTKLNIPMLPGADDNAFHEVWPELEAFVRAGKPEIILLQAGADSIRGDPITHMQFTPEAHGYAAKRLCAIADEYCDGRIIAMGGGGYNRTNLGLGWSAVLNGMLGMG